MINKGKARGDAVQLAAYLLRPENAEVLMVRGTAALDLTAALLEMEERRELTNSKYSVYHAQMNWHADEELRPEDHLKAVQILEERLGFTGQPRAVVRHNDKGREHLHVVWSLVDAENERAIRYSHNYRKHEEAARDIERRFDLRRIDGAHIDRDGQPRPERTPDHWEYEQAKRRHGQDPRAWRQSVRDIWDHSDNGASLKAAIEETRCLMANGDRRDCFVIVDEHGAILALNTKTVGARAKDIRAKLADIDRSELPSVAEARQLQRERRQEQQKGEQRSDGRAAYDVLRDEGARAARAFYWDRDQAMQQWEAGLHDAAIRFHESKEREHNPVARPSRKFTDREFLPIARPSRRFTDREIWKAEKSAERAAQVPENGTTAAALRYSVEQAEQPQQLADALQERGFRLAEVTREDTGQPWPSRYAELRADTKPAKQQDDRPAWQQPKEGELVAFTHTGHVYRFNERNTGKTREQLDEYLSGIDRSQLPSVTAAKAAAQAEQDQARAAWIEQRRIERQQERAEQIAHHETVQHISQAYFETRTGPEFVAALQLHGLTVGRASTEDAERGEVQQSYELRVQRFKAGEYVAMNEHGQIYKLDATTIVSREEFSPPQYEDESKIIARLAEIEGGNLPTVRELRAAYEHERQRQLAEPERDHVSTALNTVDTGLRKVARFADKTFDLSAEAFNNMAGSAARSFVRFVDDVLTGPSNAISGGSEAQKQQANAIASAREQARAKRTPPAQPEQPQDQGRPAEPSPQQVMKDQLERALQQVRARKQQEPAKDEDEQEHERKRRQRSRDRDR